MICNNCHGERQIKIFSKDNPLINCDICGGTGELPEGMEYDRAAGALLRAVRLIESLTLRQYCLEYGIDAAERSKNERGYFKKD